MFWLIVVALPSIYAVNCAVQFLRHRAIARGTGLPYMVFPIAETNLLYQAIFDTRIVPYVVNAWLPHGLADYINASIYKYRWAVKDRMRRKYGGVYMVVTPGSLTCNVSDASVTSQVCTARHSFPKPVQSYETLAMYGPNIVTTEKSQWSHHRRYTATSFNEKNNTLVWQESIRQVTEMLGHWVDQYSRGSSRSEFVLPDTREDILKLTLNVICGAGFGVNLPFKPAPQATTEDIQALFKDAQSPPAGYHATFRSVMEYMNRNIRSIFMANGVLSKWIPRGLLPFYATDFNAYDDLQNYLRAMVAAAGHDKSHASHNLLEEMVRSGEADRDKGRGAAQPNGAQVAGLTDEEILGNLYIFTIAGHETTAATLRYALVLLALHADIQDELYKEIREATQDEPLDPAEWDYNRVFPKLVAPLCVMLETLRLHPPVVSIPKWTDNSTASIDYQNQTYHIPPQVYVSLNVTSLHYAEEYWGSDAAMFKPWRWDQRNANSVLAGNDNVEGLSGPGLEYKTVHKPVRGSYVPFSDGVRACLGKKFAQVEFAVVVAALFRDYSVELARTSEGEATEDMRRRAERAVQGSSSFLTLGMRDEVPLLFQKRSSSASAQSHG